MRTSAVLNEGAVYSRADLAEQFAISDMTLNTGIFQPKGHDSVWLFVTEHKTPDRTQYVDRLEGDTLRWQGQSSGRKDHLIREHRARDLELLLFYRHAKKEFDNYGFRYEGVFDYVSDEGHNPASFVLHRAGADVLAIAREQAESDGAFDPNSTEDARNRVLAAIVRRQGQAAFRAQLLDAYCGRCAITGTDVVTVLEAAHIYPYQGQATNAVTNGLLLRADIHTLFDLGWIAVAPDSMTVAIHPDLQGTQYDQYQGVGLTLPEDPAMRSSQVALAWHRANVGRLGL